MVWEFAGEVEICFYSLAIGRRFEEHTTPGARADCDSADGGVVFDGGSLWDCEREALGRAEAVGDAGDEEGEGLRVGEGEEAAGAGILGVVDLGCRVTGRVEGVGEGEGGVGGGVEDGAGVREH